MENATTNAVLIDAKVSCGFATLLENFQEKSLSLDGHLIRKPASTFFLRTKGDSMVPTISSEDLLIVDRSLTPAQGHIIIAIWQGEFVCKRFYQFDKLIELRSENDNYPVINIPIESYEQFEIWGVVTYVIHATT